MEQDKIRIEKLSFPIVSFGKGNNIYFSRKLEDLTNCTSIAFKKGYYDGLKLVDSKGVKVGVESVVKIGTVGPLWGFSLMKGQNLLIHLKLKNRKDFILLNDLKKKIINIFKFDEYFWNSDGELKEKIEFIAEAKSHFEIIDYLTTEFYKEF